MKLASFHLLFAARKIFPQSLQERVQLYSMLKKKEKKKELWIKLKRETEEDRQCSLLPQETRKKKDVGWRKRRENVSEESSSSAAVTSPAPRFSHRSSVSSSPLFFHFLRFLYLSCFHHFICPLPLLSSAPLCVALCGDIQVSCVFRPSRSED